MLTDINRIATLAKEDPARKFYSIAHLITEERLRKTFWKLKKDASAGIDGVVHAEYAANVEENIRQLHRRLVEGKYQAQPLQRVYIPKENGKQRPISIPAIRDRVPMMTAVLVLDPIFEANLQPEQHAYRRDRSALDAVRHVHKLISTGHVERAGNR